MAPKPKQYQDFNPDDMVQVSQYEKDIEEVKKRIKNLEDKFGTHEDIADTLCITAEKQVKMQEMITNTFVKVLKTNEDVKNGIKFIIDGHDRNRLWWLSGKIGVGVWSIFLIVLTFILTKVFGK